MVKRKVTIKNPTELVCSGEDEEEALATLVKMIEEGFGE